MLAIIKTGGKQYKVSEKDKIKIEKLPGKEGDKVVFSEVQNLARTCSTGCEIANPEKIERLPVYNGFTPTLSKIAFEISQS